MLWYKQPWTSTEKNKEFYELHSISHLPIENVENEDDDDEDEDDDEDDEDGISSEEESY